jgi:general secretion pathway protein N
MKLFARFSLCLLPFVAAPVTAQDAVDRAAANPLARAPFERFSQTRERPLFSATRRPPPPAPVAVTREPPPPPPPEPPGLILVGVLQDSAGARALVRTSPTEKIRVVRMGDELGGWRVAEIGPRRLVLSRDARSNAYALFEGRGRATKAVANGRPHPPD